MKVYAVMILWAHSENDEEVAIYLNKEKAEEHCKDYRQAYVEEKDVIE